LNIDIAGGCQYTGFLFNFADSTGADLGGVISEYALRANQNELVRQSELGLWNSGTQMGPGVDQGLSLTLQVHRSLKTNLRGWYFLPTSQDGWGTEKLDTRGVKDGFYRHTFYNKAGFINAGYNLTVYEFREVDYAG